jgi:predicted ATPase/DNA-binding winged helix-turn-helix (wHTH) protein
MVARDTAPSNGGAISFGPFRLSPRQRLLLEAGKPVRIGSRALDLLIALVERPGELLSKDELISRVWPTTHVIEGNLKFQIAALRRALRDGQEGRRYLESSPGRGYRFVADVAVASDIIASPGPSPAPPAIKHNLPPRLTPLVGRADLIAKLVSRLRAQRLVTIVGPGGIGKTSVAFATAEQVLGDYPDGVWNVDLSRLADHAFVGSAVAAAVGINTKPEDPLETLVAGLRDARVLLVLDNCSHVIDAVARLVTAMLKTAPGVHILATSREPLRVEGEHIYRLGPLETPPPSGPLSSAEALRFPAVQLFVALAAASHTGFELGDEDAPVVGEICRRLDGIPLAIELAAARVDVLGVGGLAARLEEGLQVLTGGNRMALPRHRTMRATLDWSYGLLTPPEQTVFARLAVFAGGFTLAAAQAVVADADFLEEQIVDLVMELATKSLVAADVDLVEPRFRLTETTRAYAIEKCKERGELERLARRHAGYFLSLFETVSRDDADFDKTFAGLALELNNLRGALRWAFTPAGDLAIGVGLAASSVPLWLSMSLVGEWHRWAERALHSLPAAGLSDTHQEMQLQAALGISFQLARNRASEAHAALARGLELAEQLGDSEYQLRILHTFWIYHMRVGEVRTAIGLARRASTVAAAVASPFASATAEWLLGISEHWVGEHASARRRLEHFLQDPPSLTRSRFLHRTGFDHHVVARYHLAHIFWLQGYPDHATEAMRASLEEARQLQHPVTLCSALAFGGCSLCLRTGDLEAAERLAAELLSHAQRYALGDFLAYAKALQEILSMRKGNADVSPEQLRVALNYWRASGWHTLLSGCDVVPVVTRPSNIHEMTAIVDEELERVERHQVLSISPEMLRIKGELLLQQAEPNRELASRHFLRSLDRARAQGALSWELRTAMSLARLERTQRRTREACQLLQSVYGRFTEGFGTADLKDAKALLDELNAASQS